MNEASNGMLGDWELKCSTARPIEIGKKKSCLELFRQGNGYHKASRELGLRLYTVRDWHRRFRSGDESWAVTDGWRHWASPGAKDLVKYRHEIEAIIPGRGKDSPGDGPVVRARRARAGRQDQVAGGAEPSAAIPLYRAAEARERILAGGVRKKKEIDAVRDLVGRGFTKKDACRMAGIPRCSYYRAQAPSPKAESDAALVELMCGIENDARVSSTYGVERLTGEVNNRLGTLDADLASKILRGAEKVNRKRVHRLMKEHGIHSRIRRRGHPDSYYKSIDEMLMANRAPNILNRKFVSAEPMKKLTTDVTYIPCRDHKFLYVSPLFDLFNHEVVSYSMSAHNTEEFVAKMLTELPPGVLKGVLVHNDQGSVYWSNDWVKLCERLGIVRSMSRRGNCWDNALSEHFFSAMKADLGLTKRAYKVLLPAREVKDLVRDYIPWYNSGRIQKKLGYLSPVQFREAFLGGEGVRTNEE